MSFTLGEYIFKHIVNKNNKNSDYYIVSRATSYEEIGNDIYPPIKRVLDKYKVPYDRHFATRLKGSDYDEYDLFLCMDHYNVINTERIFLGDPKRKIHLLSEFVSLSGDVEDPWYTLNFESVLNQIKRYSELLFFKLEERS